MITSITFADIKSIVIEGEKLLIITKKEGNFESKEKIDFGMNAVFGIFEAVLSDEIREIIKKPN